MLAYRVEHPSTGVGPFVSQCPQGFGVKSKPIIMSPLDRELFRKWAKPDWLPPSPLDDIKETWEGGTDQQRHSITRNQQRLQELAKEGKITKRLGGIDLLWGFSTRSELDIWFPDEAKALLIKYGYQESLYDIPDDLVMQLQWQCGWFKVDGRLVNRQSLTAKKIAA